MNETNEFKAKRFKSSLDIKDFERTLPLVPQLRQSLDLSVFSTQVTDRVFVPAPSFLLAIIKTRLEQQQRDEINSEKLNKKKRQNNGLIEISSSSEEEQDEEEEEEEEELMEIDQKEFQKKRALRNMLPFPLDDFFRKRLKPHQLEGLTFMWKQVYEERHGCLLSHSMGLGKTIQTIALLTTLYQKKYYSTQNDFPKGKKVLILAPLTTITNWINELFMWRTSDMDTVLGEIFNFYDLASKTKKASTRINVLRHWHESGGILLMSYGQFRTLLSQEQEQDVYEYYLLSPGPDVVILDEAHQIKNANSQISQFVNRFDTLARVCLTGYPLQNNLKEYYYMLDFIAPGLLGSVDEFRASFGSWVENVYADTTKSLQALARKKMYALQLVTSRVTHRRDQSILEKDLPEKTEIIVYFKLSDAQHTGYVRLLNELMANPMSGLPWLRGICNHPKIFQTILRKRAEVKESIDQSKQRQESIFIDTDRLNETNDGFSSEATDEELLNILENKEADWDEKIFESEDIESWKCSGKMSFVLDVARKCKELGEKLVLVSHSLVTLDFVQHLLLVFGINVNRLDGSTPREERQSIIDEFHVKDNIHVMLLSAKAAAIGINVTCANRIVLIDQDWNPLYDEQSVGRVYRYGQKKKVFVYRCVTQSTIESAISSQSMHKSTMSRHVIDNKPSLLQLKQNLKKYYRVPEKDMPSVKLENIDSDILSDPVTAHAISENINMINSVELYSLKAETPSMENLTDRDRRDAKNEAKKILGKWLLGTKMANRRRRGSID